MDRLGTTNLPGWQSKAQVQQEQDGDDDTDRNPHQ